MNTETLTIRIDKELSQLLATASERTGKTKSEIARLALVRQLRLEQFEELRRRVMPFAEARGLLTDEDIFSQVS
jgi:predicted DNA-binding protein